MTTTKSWMGTVPALLLLGATAQAFQTTWQVTITDLPLLPGGIYASAYGINDTGKIVGIAMDSTGTYRNVQWLNGQISIIPAFVGGGGGLSVPEDLNDAGESVGHEHVYSSINYAVWWDSQNNPTALPGIPGGSVSSNWAHAINGPGQIAGYSREGAPNFRMHAVVWFQGSVQADLGFMGGGSYSRAYGINDAGAVVGVASDASSNTHGFLWQNGQYTNLGTWTGAGAVSYAYSLNNHGYIVGLNANVASIWHAGAVQALPMPAGLSAYTPAIDINDAGDIIATASAGYPLERGVLWRNGTPIDLGTLPGGTISRVQRINAAGEIVGAAQASDGFFHAVKWTVTAPPPGFCVGDGSTAACPCGNNGAAGSGCANSSHASGAWLGISGNASVGADTVVLTSTNITGPGLFFQADGLAASPNTFGDGLLCASTGIVRMGVVFPAAGTASFPDGATSNPIHVAGAPILAGDTKHYQCWYRDAIVFCTSATFNTTNGQSRTWVP